MVITQDCNFVTGFDVQDPNASFRTLCTEDSNHRTIGTESGLIEIDPDVRTQHDSPLSECWCCHIPKVDKSGACRTKDGCETSISTQYLHGLTLFGNR